MYSFLFFAAKSRGANLQTYEKACDITRSLMPSLGCSVQTGWRELPQVNGGWFYFWPQEIPDNRLITEFADTDLAVLVFGEMLRPSGTPTAELVAQTWKGGGLDAVRNLDGSFGAVIVDLAENTVYLVSDLMGLRTLTYFENGEVLLVSPHEVPIAATGLCPIEYDLVSAASLIACDWSLGGKSLLKTLNVCDPNEYITWRNGILRRTHEPLVFRGERIAAKNIKARNSQIDLMIEMMRDNARCLCGDAPEIQVELTAGMDSRMVTALLLSVIEPSRINAITGGDAGHYEVKTASRMAGKYCFNHKTFRPGKQSGKSFLPLSRLLAFVTNGTTNSKRATFGMPKVDPESPPSFTGNGGEIYSGFYGPSLLRRPPLDKYSTLDILQCLEGKFPRIRQLKWSDPQTAELLLSRLTCSVESLEKISSEPSDIFNLFYLFERYCRWGSGSARRTFVRKRFSLFQSPALIKLAYQLPPPITQNCLLHRTAIKRYTPEAYRWLINCNEYLPLFDYPRVSRAFAEGMIRVNRVMATLQNRLSSEKKIRAHHQLAGNVFATRLGDTLRDMLLSRGSLCRQVLQKQALEDLLDQHISGRRNHLHIIGFLVTLEQWNELMVTAANSAAKNNQST